MTGRTLTQTKTAAPTFAPVNSGVLQRSAVSNQPVNRAASIGHDVLRSSGQALDPATRAFMAPGFGHDFSQIPVHTKTPARLQAKLTVNTPGDIYEQEADAVADKVMRMATQTAPPVQRQTEEGKLVQRKTTGDAEVQTAPPIVDEVLRSPGHQLDADTRAFMEPRFGRDFSRVRVHSGAAAEQSARDVSANAYTVGHHIVFDSGRFAPGTHDGRRLLAHELTHVVQQAGTKSDQPPADVVAHVEVRTAPAMIARQSSKPEPGPPVAWGSGWFPSQGGVIPGQKAPLPPTMFEQPSAWTSAGAPAAFDAFLTLAPDEKKKAFEVSYPSGNLAKALAALGASNAQSKYADAVRDLGRWAQEYATRKTSGKTDTELAEIHGKWMEAQAVAAAKAATGTGTATPSTASIASAGAKIVANTAVPPPVPPKWDSTGFPQAKWTAAGQRAIEVIVNYATANYPSLGLKKDHFILAFKGLEMLSGAATAYHTTGPGGVSRVSIGYDFVKTVLMTDDLDKMLVTTPKPEYMIEVVVHELLGHQEFGDSDYAMSIYDAATKYRPSYTSPAEGTDERRNEKLSFGYHSTEIYAIMRGFDYKHPVAAADKAPGVVVLSDPKDEIARYVGLVAKEWEPSVGAAIMRGLYVRFKMDPRLSAASVSALADAIRTHFPSKAAVILK